MDWVAMNWRDLLSVAAEVVAGASVMLLAIARMTKNKKDDEVAGWVVKVKSLLEKVALNVKK